MYNPGAVHEARCRLHEVLSEPRPFVRDTLVTIVAISRRLRGAHSSAVLGRSYSWAVAATTSIHCWYMRKSFRGSKSCSVRRSTMAGWFTLDWRHIDRHTFEAST